MSVDSCNIFSDVKALLSRGISRPTLYEVIMPLNPGDQNAVEQLRFLCSKTSVPEAVVENSKTSPTLKAVPSSTSIVVSPTAVPDPSFTNDELFSS